MTTQDATVFVVDDDEAVRNSMEALIKSVELRVETFRSAEDFLQAASADREGCLVLDLRMPGMSGLELQRTLRERGIDLPTIIITGHGDVPVAVRAMKDGALEFLEKPFSRQMLLDTVREGLRRSSQQRQRRAAQKEFASGLATLTHRERQVMERVVAGKVNKEVAADLGLSPKTVEVHRGRVMRKLHAGTLAELVERVVTARQQTGTASTTSS